MQVGCGVPETDPLTANTGSGSQPDEDEFDDLPTEAAGDKSPDFDEEASFLSAHAPASVSDPAAHVGHNGNHDSGYVASNVEETQFPRQAHVIKVGERNLSEISGTRVSSVANLANCYKPPQSG